jgi:hypothetical protein
LSQIVADQLEIQSRLMTKYYDAVEEEGMAGGILAYHTVLSLYLLFTADMERAKSELWRWQMHGIVPSLQAMVAPS